MNRESYAQRRIRKSWQNGYKRNAAMLWLALCDKLPKNELRIALYLLARCSFDEYRELAQAEIAQDLGVQANHVATAIRGLRRKKLLKRNEESKPYSYRLSIDPTREPLTREP